MNYFKAKYFGGKYFASFYVAGVVSAVGDIYKLVFRRRRR